MAGTARTFSGLTMGGPRWRQGLTTDVTNAGYPDLITVPAGARLMGVRSVTNDVYAQDEGVSSATSLTASLSAENKAGIIAADAWEDFPVEGGSIIAIFSLVAGTSYDVAFYERGPEAD